MLQKASKISPLVGYKYVIATLNLPYNVEFNCSVTSVYFFTETTPVVVEKILQKMFQKIQNAYVVSCLQLPVFTCQLQYAAQGFLSGAVHEPDNIFFFF